MIVILPGSESGNAGKYIQSCFQDECGHAGSFSLSLNGVMVLNSRIVTGTQNHKYEIEIHYCLFLKAYFYFCLFNCMFYKHYGHV